MVRIFRLVRLSREILSLANFTNIYRQTPDSVKIGQESRALDMTTEVYFQIADRDIQTRDVATLQRTHCCNSMVTLSIIIMFLTTCVRKKKNTKRMHLCDDKDGYANAPLCHVAVHFLPSTHKFGRNVSGVLRTCIPSTKATASKFVTRLVTFLHFVCAVAQSVEALRYKPEGRGFDSRWCDWNFSLT